MREAGNKEEAGEVEDDEGQVVGGRRGKRLGVFQRQNAQMLAEGGQHLLKA
jgi:hypothetical protein